MSQNNPTVAKNTPPDLRATATHQTHFCMTKDVPIEISGQPGFELSTNCFALRIWALTWATNEDPVADKWHDAIKYRGSSTRT